LAEIFYGLIFTSAENRKPSSRSWQKKPAGSSSVLMLGNMAKAHEQQEKLEATDVATLNRLASVIVKHQM
jgi:hypothetical protein